MNILFIGPYRQSDGWGQASREYLRALSFTNNNVISRPIYLNQQQEFDDFPEFEEFECKNSNDIDVVIQNCLPSHFRKYGEMKNIGISFFETCNISNTPWVSSINIMDEIWVSSYFEQNTLSDSGVNIPVRIVNIPTDVLKYDKEYEPFDFNRHKDDFKFYFIGEYVGRKDINSLLLAFHREFKVHEPVQLVLKLNKVGHDPSFLLELVRRDIKNFKSSVGIHKDINDYKQEIIIPTYLSQEELYGVHKACDCFVMPSSGEAFCLPAFDAMAFGKMSVINSFTSMSSYIVHSNNGLWVDAHRTPAITTDRPLPYLYNGLDEWYQIDVLDLQDQMRIAYDHRFGYLKDNVAEFSKQNILPEYTYQSVAKVMNKLL